MRIFLVLNGIGVGFLIYVLVNFWREGQRTRHVVSQANRLPAGFGRAHNVVVATGFIASGAKKPDESIVVPFPISQARTNASGTPPVKREDATHPQKYASK